MRRAQRSLHLFLWVGFTLVIVALLTVVWLHTETPS